MGTLGHEQTACQVSEVGRLINTAPFLEVSLAVTSACIVCLSDSGLAPWENKMTYVRVSKAIWSVHTPSFQR